MSRTANILSYIFTLLFTILSLFVVVYISDIYYDLLLWEVMLLFLAGAIVVGFILTLVHELSHLISGKINGFQFSAITIWFLKWYKEKNKVKFKFTIFGEEAGYTEMIPKTCENLAIRYKNMALAGPISSLVLALVGIVPLFFNFLPAWLFCGWALFLPLGIYFFLSSLLPSSSGGVRNDGGVIYGINKNDDSTKVMLNILSIQAQMFQGKTPAQVDKSLYFDLPQLPEDDINFIMLLNARYLYHLDKGEYQKATKITDRLISLAEDMPKEFLATIMTDALYNACTFDFNPQLADEITEDYEKYLNSVNTVSVVRSKLAYLLYVKGEKDKFDIFYKKGLREASKGQIKGLNDFEIKLFEKMKDDFEKQD